MPTTLLIENLYPKIDVTDLCKEFGKYGRILSAKIECDENFTSLGKGYICYFDLLSANMAVKEKKTMKKLGNSIRITVDKFEKQRNFFEARRNDDSKIFVKNLDPIWDECDILKIFKAFGDIDEIKISDTDGISNGYGYIKFQRPASARRAITEMNDLPINEKKLIVEPFVSWEVREESQHSLEFAKMHAVEWNNLHIKNLDKDVTEDELTELFKRFGSIISVKIPMCDSGKSRGFGFVCFVKKENAAIACKQMDNYTYRSKRLEVSFNQKKYARQKYLKAIKSDPLIRHIKGGK